MPSHRSRAAQALVVVLTGALFIGAAHLLLSAAADAQNHRQLEELNGLALRRAELAIDYAFTALGETAEQGIISCDEAVLEEIRGHVYQRSTVKDIRVVHESGQVICSAFPKTLSFDLGQVAADDTLASRNEQVRLFRLDQQSGSTLGVLWRILDEIGLLAVVGTDALLYDMLPAELRDHSEMQLMLANGSVVARFSADGGAGPVRDPIRFSVQSERYPLRSVMDVDATTFDRWNKEPQPLFLAIGGLLGLAFGWLLVRALARPKSPVTELDDALAAGEFRPFMQPVFSLATGEIVGCEVLARWLRSDGSIVPPSRFSPLAEESGRIVPLTHQIISQALADLQPWMRANKAFKVAFNIVGSHLVAPGFVDELRKLASSARVSARQIVIELTEREELHDLEKAAGVIADLREHGFKVAIDDAGTGHSGLSYIHKLGVSTIKIDKFFIDSIGFDRTAQAVVEMLVRLARELGMTTVAEGIESDEPAVMLEACGVDEGQGFGLSPPIAAAAFLAMLGEHRPRRMDEAPRIERVA